MAGVFPRCAFPASVAFAPGEPRPDSVFTISPARPTERQVIEFFDPYDRRRYQSPCYAARFKGIPRLLIDPSSHTIDLTLGPDVPEYCTDAIEWSSGLRGDFGRLAPGTWTYRSFETHTFTVRAVPEPAALTFGALANLGLMRRRQRCLPS